jgi:hypothetical protein
MTGMATLQAQAEAERLQHAIRQHKSAIRSHREALGSAKAALDRLEAECRARGIRLVLVPRAPGAAKDSSHGQSRASSPACPGSDD